MKLETTSFYLRGALRSKGLKGLSNLGLLYLSLALRRNKVLGQPIYLQLEITNRCNLKCTTCRRTYEKDMKLGDLNFENYQEIINQFDHLISLTLCGLGEPLLNKDLPKFIQYAKRGRKIARVSLFTNGTLLNNDVAEKLVDSGLDRLVISIDGATASVFEKVRVGGSFDKVIENTKGIVDTIGKLNSGLRVEVNCTVTEDTFGDLPSLVKLLNSIGIKHLDLAVVNFDFPEKEELKFVPNGTNMKRLTELGKSLGVSVTINTCYTDCLWLWVRHYISWDGYLLPCCFKPMPEEFNLGNVLEEPFRKVWNSPRAKIFRTKLASANPPALCKNCPSVIRRTGSGGSAN